MNKENYKRSRQRLKIGTPNVQFYTLIDARCHHIVKLVLFRKCASVYMNLTVIGSLHNLIVRAACNWVKKSGEATPKSIRGRHFVVLSSSIRDTWRRQGPLTCSRSISIRCCLQLAHGTFFNANKCVCL